MGALYLIGIGWVATDWPVAFRWGAAIILGAYLLQALRDFAAWLLATNGERDAFLALVANAEVERAAALRAPMGAWVQPWHRMVLGLALAGSIAALTRYPNTVTMLLVIGLLAINALFLLDVLRGDQNV